MIAFVLPDKRAGVELTLRDSALSVRPVRVTQISAPPIASLTEYTPFSNPISTTALINDFFLCPDV